MSAAVPDRLAELLQRAHAAESIAIGPDRVDAFRLTRALIGGARELGYSAPQLAQCLGVTVATLHTRSQPDGWIDAAAFAQVAGVRLDTVRRWRRQGRLPEPRTGEDGSFYPARDLIRASIGVASRRRAVLAGDLPTAPH